MATWPVWEAVLRAVLGSVCTLAACRAERPHYLVDTKSKYTDPSDFVGKVPPPPNT